MIHPPAFFLQKGWSTANYLEHLPGLISCKRTDQCNMFFVCKLSRSLPLAGLLQKGQSNVTCFFCANYLDHWHWPVSCKEVRGAIFCWKWPKQFSPGLFLQRGWSAMSFSFSLHNSASSCLVVFCKKDGRMCHVFLQIIQIMFFANYPGNPSGAVLKRTVLYFFFVNDLDNFLNIFCFVFWRHCFVLEAFVFIHPHSLKRWKLMTSCRDSQWW